MTRDAPISRLAREFKRLFLPSGTPLPVGAELVRALVLEVSRPAAWQPLSAVWQGVQADLGLPAPAIAVNGTDGLQLWFSLTEGVDALQGHALLEDLRQQYMADVPLHRVAMQAAPVPVAIPRPIHDEGPWSAFVAGDLAPIFEESPWLDLAPNEGGQADLLSRLASIQPAALKAALERLHSLRPATPITRSPATAAGPGAGAGPLSAMNLQAQRFLLSVMKDEAAPLPLRVEAAIALLPYPEPD
jgi:hypothetical protein